MRVDTLTADQAHRVLGTENNDQTYEAGIYFADLAAAGLSVHSELTNAMDALAVRQMKRASAEWLEVVHLPERRSAYLDRWVHDEALAGSKRAHRRE